MRMPPAVGAGKRATVDPEEDAGADPVTES